jgi:hypothetical protein
MKRIIDKNEKKIQEGDNSSRDSSNVSTPKEQLKNEVTSDEKHTLTPMYNNTPNLHLKKEILERIQEEMKKELEPLFTKSLFTKEGRNDLLEW